MELNPIALQYIYDETLFHFNGETQISTKNDTFLGENKSNISILSNKSFDKSDIDLLEKILLALNLKFEDIALIQKKESREVYAEIVSETKPKKIVLFGLSPFEINMKDLTLNKYEILESNGTKILQGDPFEQYHNDPSKKKALWFALQKLIA